MNPCKAPTTPHRPSTHSASKKTLLVCEISRSELKYLCVVYGSACDSDNERCAWCVVQRPIHVPSCHRKSVKQGTETEMPLSIRATCLLCVHCLSRTLDLRTPVCSCLRIHTWFSRQSLVLFHDCQSCAPFLFSQCPAVKPPHLSTLQCQQNLLWLRLNASATQKKKLRSHSLEFFFVFC